MWGFKLAKLACALTLGGSVERNGDESFPPVSVDRAQPSAAFTLPARCANTIAEYRLLSSNPEGILSTTDMMAFYLFVLLKFDFFISEIPYHP